ncbi:MAG: hypothetical protein IJB33_03690 [Akkermansia sp.]|nr:hypothetical protein [Akkermansia sp.]
MLRLFRVLNFLLPVVLFVAVLLKVRDFFDAGDVRTGLLVALGAVVVLTIWMTGLIRCSVLPAVGQAIGERVYGGSYLPEDDPLVVLATRIRREHESSLLPEFEALVRREPFRARAWTELASLRGDEFGDFRGAREALMRGAEMVEEAEDRAFLLYRAAGVCERRLGDAAGARELYNRAAECFPATAYGRKAAQKAASRG